MACRLQRLFEIGYVTLATPMIGTISLIPVNPLPGHLSALRGLHHRCGHPYVLLLCVLGALPCIPAVEFLDIYGFSSCGPCSALINAFGLLVFLVELS